MNLILGDILQFGQSAALTGFLAFLRVGAAIAVLPVFGERSVPQRVRLAIAIGFTLVVAPIAYQSSEVPDQIGYWALIYLFSEVAAGLTIGISLRLLVHALQIAGSIAAQSTSLSQIFGAAGTDPQPAIGHVLVVGGLALAVTFGLHVKVAELLIYSYQIMEPGKFISAPELSGWGISQVAQAFSLAFSLAAPFVIASLIYNIAMGAINRAMPQLMVSFVGAPAITAGALMLLFIAAPLMLSTWSNALDGFFANPFVVSP